MDDQKIESLTQFNQHFATEFQSEFFVVGCSGPTDYGKFKQAVRELDVRHEGYKSGEISLGRLLLRRKRLIFWQRVLPWRRQERSLKILEVKYEIQSCESVLKDTDRERREFYRLAHELRGKLGVLTNVEMARLEAENWKQRLIVRAAMELVACGGVTKATVEAIAAMPNAGELMATILQGNAAELAGVAQAVPNTSEPPGIESHTRSAAIALEHD